eukprot:scaffold269263_cov18-Tisochrysis_lutea.AAC.2
MVWTGLSCVVWPHPCRMASDGLTCLACGSTCSGVQSGLTCVMSCCLTPSHPVLWSVRPHLCNLEGLGVSIVAALAALGHCLQGAHAAVQATHKAQLLLCYRGHPAHGHCLKGPSCRGTSTGQATRCPEHISRTAMSGEWVGGLLCFQPQPSLATPVYMGSVATVRVVRANRHQAAAAGVIVKV